ncbi:MAG: cation:proton antiporter [Planctomycetota bacterium]
MDAWNLLLDIVLLLGAALVGGGRFARLGQSPTLGYLLAGVLIGLPGSGGLLQSHARIEAISELGVTLLLFSLALEFSWRRLRALGSPALLAGAAQVVATGVVVAAIAVALGMQMTHAVAFGAMLALSSTAGVLRVLMDRSELDSPHGRTVVAILLMQDIAVVPLAILMGVLGGGRTPVETVWELGRILLMATGLIVLIYLVVNKVAVRLLGALSIERTRELTTLISFVIGFGSAWGAHAAGLSPALGAFLAGMLLGASPFATQIRADVSSLRVVLLTLFFTSAGLAADPAWILDHVGLVLGVSAAIVVGKAAVVWGVTRAFGVPNRVGGAAGLALGQIGEFAFVLGGMGAASGVVSPETQALVLSCAIITLFATPYLVAHGPRLAGIIFWRAPAPVHAAREKGPELIIVGFGPAGQAVARALQGRLERVLVIDLNPRTVGGASEFGMQGEVGDATQLDVLEHARLGEARMVALTLPSPEISLLCLRQIRRLAPHVPVMVRNRSERYAPEFIACGASAVVGDEAEVGATLGRRVREALDTEA